LRAGIVGLFVVPQTGLEKETRTMSFTRWLSKRLGLSARPASRRKTAPARPNFRPTLEALEHRWVPSTLTVQNTLDSGAGSLRAEIAAAHSGDTINFATSLDGQTIKLTSGELLINKTLTIAGPADRSLTVSGGGISRVFEVPTPAKHATRNVVSLSGLTISNGVGVFAASSSHYGDGEGGAILNWGTLTVSNCILSGNSAAGGGGGAIENQGPLTISASTLTNNVAPNNSGGGLGGAIQSFAALTVSDSTVSSNTAGWRGGGIWEGGGTLTVSSSTVSGNFAGYGGGIAVEFGSTALIDNCTLNSNSARVKGGAIYITNSNSTVTVSGSTLSGNTAIKNNGGGIWNDGTLTVKSSSSITGNTAPVGFGADLYNLGVLYLDASSIIGILDGNPAVPI